jgi:glutathione S-transferase
MPVLYQFAGSPYCEKARWALDYKAVQYETRNLIPGPHIKATRKIAKKSSVPILIDDAQVVQGSAEIISYLEKTVRHPLLTPTNSQDASMAHEWERYLDRNLGVPLGVFFYHYALRDREMVSDFLLHGTPWWGRPLYILAFPGIRRQMKKSMGIDVDAAEVAVKQLNVTFDRLDERLTQHKFLAGPQFSRADLTASALLFHRWSEHWRWPPELDEFIDQCKQRPFYAWAEAIYQKYRPST